MEILSINEWNLDSSKSKNHWNIGSNPENKYNTYSKSTIETLEEGVMCSKLTMTTVERWPRCQWRLSEVFIDNFDYVSHVVIVFLLLTLGMYLFAGIDEYNTA